MQKKKRLHSFFSTLSELGSGQITVFLYGIVFNVANKPACLYLWCAFATVNYLQQLLKSIYSQDRPFWVSDDIHSDKCLLGYGNPSGHMVDNTFVWVSLYLHFYYDVGVQRKRMSVFCTAYIIKMALSVALTIYLFLMAVSRVYLGAHSWNQVLFGFTWGVAFALIGHYQIKRYFYDFWDSCIQDGRYRTPWQELVKMLVLVIVLSFLSLTIM